MGHDRNALIKEQFGREAKKYINPIIHSRKDDLAYVLDFIKPQKNWKALDIATGGGNLAILLAPYLTEIIATDITPQMLEQTEKSAKAQSILNLTTKIADVHELPFEENYFDLVAVRIAPHHFHSIDVAIKEMIRVTKPSGTIFVQDTMSPLDSDDANFLNRIERLRDPSHVHTLNQKEWSEHFIANGCVVTNLNTKVKHWPIEWWFEQMSTPLDNRKKVLRLIEDRYPNNSSDLSIEKDQKGEWIISPYNLYLLAQKS